MPVVTGKSKKKTIIKIPLLLLFWIFWPEPSPYHQLIFDSHWTKHSIKQGQKSTCSLLGKFRPSEIHFPAENSFPWGMDRVASRVSWKTFNKGRGADIFIYFLLSPSLDYAPQELLAIRNAITNSGHKIPCAVRIVKTCCSRRRQEKPSLLFQ